MPDIVDWGDRIDDMLDAVLDQALHTGWRRVHVGLLKGPSPAGEGGLFVVATWAFADRVYMAWQAAGQDPYRIRQLWVGKAQARRLPTGQELAHAQAWPCPPGGLPRGWRRVTPDNMVLDAAPLAVPA